MFGKVEQLAEVTQLDLDARCVGLQRLNAPISNLNISHWAHYLISFTSLQHRISALLKYRFLKPDGLLMRKPCSTGVKTQGHTA